jgi:hypothetical protein
MGPKTVTKGLDAARTARSVCAVRLRRKLAVAGFGGRSCISKSIKSDIQPDGSQDYPDDDYAGALANFKKNGTQILEERVKNGRHVWWVATPEGAQMVLIEKV